MKIHIIGAGLTGIACSHLFPNDEIVLCEQTDKVGGLCINTDFEYKRFRPNVYGEHIFHTDREDVFNLYKKLFNEIEFYEHKAKVFIDGDYLPFPVNKETLEKLDINVNSDLKEISLFNIKDNIKLIEKIYRPYSEKQWGLDLSDISKIKNIIDRIKIRLTNEERYFTSKYQYIPKNNSFDFVIPKNVELRLNTKVNVNDFSENDFVINTSSIDEFYNFKYGKLPYRTLEFKFIKKNYSFPETITTNYPSKEFNFTRKHTYENYVSFEYPKQFSDDSKTPRMYPTKKLNYPNVQEIKSFYKDKERNIYHLGRLGTYKYLDMDKCLEQVLDFYNFLFFR